MQNQKNKGRFIKSGNSGSSCRNNDRNSSCTNNAHAVTCIRGGRTLDCGSNCRRNSSTSKGSDPNHGIGKSLNNISNGVNGDNNEVANNGKEKYVEKQMRTLCVSNLSEKVQEAMLRDLFGTAGAIKEIKFGYANDGRRLNFAFIEFEAVSSVLQSLQAFRGVKLYQKELMLLNRLFN